MGGDETGGRGRDRWEGMRQVGGDETGGRG